MSRKRLTQRFPALIPLRQAQRKACFYLVMRLDGRRYAAGRRKLLPLEVFSQTVPLYNRETGFPMVYQENKVFNLHLAAKELEGLLIRPGETFSFFRAVREADRETSYRDGLIVVNGELTTAPGGGLCQLSNLLFWLFLHSPLTIVERSGHREKDFPDLGDQPAGVDATVAEGWVDLKVRNDTQETFQLTLSFGAETMTGTLRADRETGVEYRVENRGLQYLRRGGAVIEEVDVLRREICRATGELLREQILYHNSCRIGYPLAAGLME